MSVVEKPLWSVFFRTLQADMFDLYVTQPQHLTPRDDRVPLDYYLSLYNMDAERFDQLFDAAIWRAFGGTYLQRRRALYAVTNAVKHGIWLTKLVEGAKTAATVHRYRTSLTVYPRGMRKLLGQLRQQQDSLMTLYAHPALLTDELVAGPLPSWFLQRQDVEYVSASLLQDTRAAYQKWLVVYRRLILLGSLESYVSKADA